MIQVNQINKTQKTSKKAPAKKLQKLTDSNKKTKQQINKTKSEDTSNEDSNQQSFNIYENNNESKKPQKISKEQRIAKNCWLLCFRRFLTILQQGKLRKAPQNKEKEIEFYMKIYSKNQELTQTLEKILRENTDIVKKIKSKIQMQAFIFNELQEFELKKFFVECMEQWLEEGYYDCYIDSITKIKHKKVQENNKFRTPQTQKIFKFVKLLKEELYKQKTQQNAKNTEKQEYSGIQQPAKELNKFYQQQSQSQQSFSQSDIQQQENKFFQQPQISSNESLNKNNIQEDIQKLLNNYIQQNKIPDMKVQVVNKDLNNTQINLNLNQNYGNTITEYISPKQFPQQQYQQQQQFSIKAEENSPQNIDQNYQMNINQIPQQQQQQQQQNQQQQLNAPQNYEMQKPQLQNQQTSSIAVSDIQENNFYSTNNQYEIQQGQQQQMDISEQPINNNINNTICNAQQPQPEVFENYQNPNNVPITNTFLQPTNNNNNISTNNMQFQTFNYQDTNNTNQGYRPQEDSQNYNNNGEYQDFNFNYGNNLNNQNDGQQQQQYNQNQDGLQILSLNKDFSLNNQEFSLNSNFE